MDFSTTLAGLCLTNPLVAAAGPNGRTGRSLKRQAEGGAGAVVTKSIAMNPIPLSALPCPRLIKVKSGLLLTDLHSDKDLKQWQKEIKIAKEGNVPVIASIQSLSKDPTDDVETMAPLLEKAGADAIELAAFGLCSNVATFSGIGPVQDPDRTFLVTKTVKKAVSVPVITKLSPELSNFVDLLKAAEKGGADAVAMRDTLVPAISFDLKTGYPLVTRYKGVSWLPEIGGNAMKQIALGYVVEAARRTNIPIIGIGGISSWEDAIEMLMAGATCIGICTASITTGPSIFKRIMKGIETYMLNNDLESLSQIRGLGLRRLEEMWARKRSTPMHASVTSQRCNGCGLCESVCLYDAIILKNLKAQVEKNRCTGCGLCKSICPTTALDLHQNSLPSH